MDVSAKVEGLQTFVRAVGKAKAAIKLSMAEGVKKCAEVILKKSQVYVPVDTGDLKRSGRVEVSGSGMGAKAAVIYRDPVAVIVHEDMEAQHAPPTQAKFVERAVRESRGTCAAIMKRELEIGR